MSFAEVGNELPNSPWVINLNALKIAEAITFPDITGRDAPGKEGLAAKPALVTEVGLGVFSPSGARVAFTIWNSRGSGESASASYTIPDDDDPFVQRSAPLVTPRSVFSGSTFYVGARLLNPTPGGAYNLGFGWGLVSLGFAREGSARYDTKDTSGFIPEKGSAGPGALSWRLYYDVLPTEPLGLSGTLGGPTDTDITITWNVVNSDGGKPVTGYRIQRQVNPAAGWTTLVENSGTTTRSYTDSNLTPGVTYRYRVAAINAVAQAAGSDYSGPYSAEASVFITTLAGNAKSFLTATVTDPEPEPLIFTDFGNGIRFTAISVQYGSEYLYNEVQATRQSEFAVTQVASAPGSKEIYGLRDYSVTSLLNSTDQGAFDVAKELLTSYYEPELRVDSITVDLSNLSIEEKLQVLALEIDDYISVSFTPNGIGDPKIKSGLITGISHRITITTHEVELRLRNQRTLFTLNSDSKGILNVNILGP